MKKTYEPPEPKEPWLPSDVSRCTGFPRDGDEYTLPCEKREGCLRYLTADVDAVVPFTTMDVCLTTNRHTMYMPYRP